MVPSPSRNDDARRRERGRPASRRRALGLIGGGATPVLAGCAGDLFERDDEENDRENGSDWNDGRSIEGAIPESVEITMHPSPFSEPIAELGGNLGEWAFVREHVDSVQWHGAMTPPNDAGDEGEAFVQSLVESGVRIGIEISGPDERWKPFDDGIAERTAQAVSEPLIGGAIKAFGGELDYVTIDGPIKRLWNEIEWMDEYEGFETRERSAEVLVDFMIELRERHPGVTPWLITNFPNWGWDDGPSVTGRDWGDY